MAYTRASQAAALDGKVTGAVFAAPPDAPHRQLLSALVAEGLLSPAGAYRPGKGQADVLRSLAVPSVTQETLHRVCWTLGL